MKTQEELMEQNRLIIADTKKRFKKLMARNTRPVDDVAYNQEWWSWYCNEHKLDIKTGKSEQSEIRSKEKLPKNPFHVLF